MPSSNSNGGNRTPSSKESPSKDNPNTQRSPRKSHHPSPGHLRRSKRLCEDGDHPRLEESPHRRKRGSSGVRMGQKEQGSRVRGTSEGHHHPGEEFVFWKPEESSRQMHLQQHLSSRPPGGYRNSPSKIPIPNNNKQLSGRHGRPNRPKMGVPVMTSTPRLIFGGNSPAKREEGGTKKEEEPIYCEIGDSAEGSNNNNKHNCMNNNINNKKARSESSEIFRHQQFPHHHSSSLHRNECDAGKRNRLSSDFPPHRMNTRNQHHQPLSASPLPSQRRRAQGSFPEGLLGRRAATQFDFFGGEESKQAQLSALHPQHQHAPSSTTVLSEYRHELPPKSIYNHMSGIPYSQPPQRKFIPGLNGINGYCSDNDFSSLANESIASSSLPGQNTLRGDLSEINVNPGSTLKKGLLWQQRDKLFSRWKERFFILTKDYLQCFRRGSSRISEMGAFIFRIKLIEVEEVELIDKRGYLTISLSMGKEGKVLLRKPDGIRDWFNILKECVSSCKERRGMMKSSKEFWSKKQFTDSSSMEQYIMARQRTGRQFGYYSESNQSFPFDSNALPSHLRMKMKGSLNPLPTTQHTHVSTNNLKHYGYIDVPRSSSSYGNAEGDEKGQIQSLCNDLYLKGNVRDYPSEYSHDSGVDSMNTNSSGSVMSGSITSPMMNRPSKFVFKSPEEDNPLSQIQGKHLKSERDRKISLV